MCPGSGHVLWGVSHAAIPVVSEVNGAVSVYFSARDADGRSMIGVGAFDLARPADGFVAAPAPVLGLGPLGAFDDSGVTTACLAVGEGRRLLYYTGWTRGVTVPFYFYIGVAAERADGSYARVSAAPVLERNAIDPYLTASPSVLYDNGSWRMWYVSCVRWDLVDGQPRHYYHIKYAESSDAIAWTRTGTVCIDFAPGEYAFARPHVVKDADGLYRMWYSYRGDRYRIGYAESRDGISWERKDHLAGIDVSASGWDSEMVAYPTVFDHGGQRYMLYNGNGYGRTGFGLAIAR